MNPDLELQGNIGQLLASSFELIEKIVTNLNYAEIQSIRSVCKAWNAVGTRLLEKRRGFHYHTFPSSFSDVENEVLVDFSATAQELFEDLFSSIRSKPRYCIGFATGDWILTQSVVTKYTPKGSPIGDLLKTVLPANCDIALTTARGVVGTIQKSLHKGMKPIPISGNHLGPLLGRGDVLEPPSTSQDPSCRLNGVRCPEVSNVFEPRLYPWHKEVGPSLEIEISSYLNLFQTEALSLLLIPDLPGVKITIIEVKEDQSPKQGDQCSRSLPLLTDEQLNDMCGLSQEDDLKGLLFFGANVGKKCRSFLSSAVQRQKNKIALGGGIVDGVQQKGSLVESNLAVLISGPNVATASVIIPQMVKKVSNIDKYIMQLKDCNLPEYHSVAFMFACCGRGYSWYRGKGRIKSDSEFRSAESKAFRKRFPFTPIFGFFGEGEFGVNYLDKINTEGIRFVSDPRPGKRFKQTLEHQFTTIIVLVSFL